jgi:hypothetical protein
MPAGLILAIAFAASSASAPGVYGPVRPDPPKPAAKQPVADPCATAQADGNTREIVICAQRPQGYRLNPDVMEAKREMRSGGAPRNPHESFRQNDCATVGSMPCLSPGINLLAAVSTLAAMAQRLAKGQEIGSMFVTDPTPNEYQLYVAAKKRREAKEAEAALDAAAKAKAAAAAASPAPAAAKP